MKVVSFGQPSRRRGVLMFIMLITAYIIFATNWVAGSNLSKQITDHFSNGEKVSPADGFKDKFIYYFSLRFGGFLFLYVITLVSLPRVVAEHAHNSNFKLEFMILTITVGGLLGTLSNIFVTRKIDFRRKPFLVVHGLMMIGFMVAGLYVVSFNEVLAYILFALSGFAMYLQYPVYLNYPYELSKMNSQKLIIMFGMF